MGEASREQAGDKPMLCAELNFHRLQLQDWITEYDKSSTLKKESG
jgi:hypothetical protein